MFKDNLEKLNFLWKVNLTQDDLDKLLEQEPTLLDSYYVQERIFKKYGERK